MIYCYLAGKFKEKNLQQIVLDYHLRLKKLWPVTLVEISDKPKEVERFLETKKNRGLLVSLDAEGEQMDSSAFIKWVTQSSTDIYFFAWGADGPPPKRWELKMKSLSLSPMTYSHELARVLLLEQLYRAGATLRGHPYSR